jgi:hypothetical protein
MIIDTGARGNASFAADEQDLDDRSVVSDSNQRCAHAGACRWGPCAAIYGRADPAWDRQLQPDRPRSFPTEPLFECLRCEQCPRNARQLSAFNQWLCPRRADQCGAESAIAGDRSDGSTLGVPCRRRWRRCGLHTVILAVHPECRPWRQRRASSSAGRWLLEYQRSIGVVEPSYLGPPWETGQPTIQQQSKRRSTAHRVLWGCRCSLMLGIYTTSRPP